MYAGFDEGNAGGAAVGPGVPGVEEGKLTKCRISCAEVPMYRFSSVYYLLAGSLEYHCKMTP